MIGLLTGPVDPPLLVEQTRSPPDRDVVLLRFKPNQATRFNLFDWFQLFQSM